MKLHLVKSALAVMFALAMSLYTTVASADVDYDSFDRNEPIAATADSSVDTTKQPIVVASRDGFDEPE